MDLLKQYAKRLTILFFISFILSEIAWMLQENFYHEPNVLYGVEQALRFQTSSTSFMYAIEDCLLVGMMMCWYALWIKFYDLRIVKYVVCCFCITIAIGGIGHEILQILHPPYPDNNILDMIVSTIGCGLSFWYLFATFPSE